MARKQDYRLVTPPHMDVVVPFKSQDDALSEAKKRGTYHPTYMMVKGLDGEWSLVYDSSKDEKVERRRLAREDFKEYWVEPYVSDLITRIMGRNPILFFRKAMQGGFIATEVFIDKDEDPLPILRALLNQDNFMAFVCPYEVSECIKRFYPYGDNAEYLFKNPPIQKSLFD